MLPREKSPTRSTASVTNKGTDASLQYVKGIGPKLAVLFETRGFQTVWDLLTFFPRAYQDRQTVTRVEDLQEGTLATVQVQIRSKRWVPLRGRGRSMLEVRAEDESGTLSLKWFHAPRDLDQRLIPGKPLQVIGTAKYYRNQWEMIHPELGFSEPSQESLQHSWGRVVPIYVEIEGLPTRFLRKILWNALQSFSRSIPEDLPVALRSHYHFPLLREALQQIHFPTEKLDAAFHAMASPSHQRMIYEEFLKFQILVLKYRLELRDAAAFALSAQNYETTLQRFLPRLPFTLTQGQQDALKSIGADLSESKPMNRLVQGDVGSGKTVVALLAAAAMLDQGKKVALMVPTEILANQHYAQAIKLLSADFAIGLLTGSSSNEERGKVLSRLKNKGAYLIIGTHALLEDPVEIKDLMLLIIDEQHRFGVNQRKILREKEKGELAPHILLMTATPIPRTLALTAYGSLAVTSIKELPPGRKPIATHFVYQEAQVARAYEAIRAQLKAGRQAYFIYPLVQQSEAEGFTEMKSVLQEVAFLRKSVFPEFSVEALHGQMGADEKQSVMDRFKKGKLHILASTTVVEVGVDVPNATVIAIEHAERFGLSQLHQLRGRVGRGEHASFCYLLAAGHLSDVALARLQLMEKSQDGFEIAEVDLRIRGPGEVLGTRQSGALAFRMADLVRDQDWLLRARNDAVALLKADPQLLQEENQGLRRFMLREGAEQLNRLRTG